MSLEVRPLPPLPFAHSPPPPLSLSDKPADSETVARRKRNLIRAVVDETRTMTSQLSGRAVVQGKPYL
jgi:hypothetical protein